MYFLDATVFMYAFGTEHAYREPCKRILRGVTSGEIAATTSAEVLQEIAHRYFAINRRAEAVRVLRALPGILRVILPLRSEDMALVPDLAEKYPRLGARDVAHMSVMIANGLRRIVTADRDFDGLEEVERMDPADLAASLQAPGPGTAG